MSENNSITDAFVDNRNEIVDSGASPEKLKHFDIANIPVALYTIADILNDQDKLLSKQNELITKQNKILQNKILTGSRIGGYRG